MILETKDKKKYIWWIRKKKDKLILEKKIKRLQY